MSQRVPEEVLQSSQPATVGLNLGALTLRQAADALGSSTTTLRKMIRQGLLPEAEKVKTLDGRVWSIQADSIPGIAARAGFTISLVEAIDLRDPDLDREPEPDLDREPEPDLDREPVATPVELDAQQPEPGTALQSIGADGDVEHVSTGEPNLAPTLSDVVDTALLEKLLGAKEAETVALVKAERHRSEYDALAARQLEVEQRYVDVDLQRSELSDRLQSEALARAISDARVTELRDQLQREITYAEAERYERRQALARETRASSEAAEIRAALGWWGRRKLRRRK